MDNPENKKPSELLIEEEQPSKDIEEKKPKNKFLSKLAMIGVAILAFLKISKLLFIGKLLLTVLKASKFASMIISMAVTIVIYAQLYGWLFAIGFVIIIFIHEMGHYLTSKKIGLDVTAPMFIPFLGAFISMKKLPKNVKEEAITAIGGPVAGTIAAIGCLELYFLTGTAYWVGLAYVGAFLNLFNLLPFGPLDGGRVAKALSPLLWVIGFIVSIILIWKLEAYILLLILLLGIIEVITMFRNKTETAKYLEVEPRFRLILGLSYIFLLSVLAVLMMYTLDISQSIHSLGK